VITNLSWFLFNNFQRFFASSKIFPSNLRNERIFPFINNQSFFASSKSCFNSNVASAISCFFYITDCYPTTFSLHKLVAPSLFINLQSFFHRSPFIRSTICLPCDKGPSKYFAKKKDQQVCLLYLG
jgi:hypothetical protein